MVYGFGFCISDLKYNLTYNLEGGVVDNPTTYTVNTETFTLNNPSKEGYTFKGWSGTELEGNENTVVTIEKGSTGDREYTANYIPNTYQVQFNVNGGSGSIDNQTMTYDVNESLTKNIFTKVQHKFLGWNTLVDGTGTSYLDEEEVSNLTTVNGEVVNLYAQWELLPTRYAVQIYGIYQDVDEDDNVLGLTFGPATGADYNNAYVTHKYVANDEGTYNIEIVTTTVDENGFVKEEIEELLDTNNNNVTRTEEQVAQRQNINLHEMSWEEIFAVADKTLFEDCMLCGDTKSVELTLNSELKTNNLYNQYGDGAGNIAGVLKTTYRTWNPSQSENEYVGSEASGAVLTDEEKENGSNGSNAGGYSSSHIRATLIGENEKTNRGYAGNINLIEENSLYSCIENEVKNVISSKKIRYAVKDDYIEENYIIKEDIEDPIWLFSEREIYGTAEVSGYTGEGLGDFGEGYMRFSNTQSKYYISVYNIDENKAREAYYEPGLVLSWYLRSIDLDRNTIVRRVYGNGGISIYYAGHLYGGIAFGFCIK